MSPQKEVTLNVGFDITQVGDQLAYKFTSDDGGEPCHPTGLYCNEIFFDLNDIVHLKVLGGGKIKDFASFEILDCCLITKPLVIGAGKEFTTYSASSPFVGVAGATNPIAPADFSATEQDDTKRGYRLITQSWNKSFTAVDTYGRWDLSLVLTVLIRRNDGSELSRTFSFDPEGQVGAGGGSDAPK